MSIKRRPIDALQNNCHFITALHENNFHLYSAYDSIKVAPKRELVMDSNDSIALSYERWIDASNRLMAKWERVRERPQ